MDGWTDKGVPPICLSLDGAMQVSVAGGPEPGPGEKSGDSEQTDAGGELDTAAQAQPLGSKVSLPQPPPCPPVTALGSDFLEISVLVVTPPPMSTDTPSLSCQTISENPEHE